MRLVPASSPITVQSTTRAPLASRLFAVLTALFAVFLVAALTAAPASAHNTLQATDPKDGETLAQAPEAITLTFDDKVIDMGSLIVVTGPDGTEVADGAPVIDSNIVTQPLSNSLPAGEYEVQWRVTSADGHPIDGEFTFTTEAAAGAEEPAEPTEEPSASQEPTSDAEPTQDATSSAPSPSEASDDESDGFGVGAVILVVVVVAGAAAAVVVIVNKRRQNKG